MQILHSGTPRSGRTDYIALDCDHAFTSAAHNFSAAVPDRGSVLVLRAIHQPIQIARALTSITDNAAIEITHAVRVRSPGE